MSATVRIRLTTNGMILPTGVPAWGLILSVDGVDKLYKLCGGSSDPRLHPLLCGMAAHSLMKSFRKERSILADHLDGDAYRSVFANVEQSGLSERDVLTLPEPR